jgi:general secretion pathway protein A
MYNEFFSLRENPFNVNPDPRFLFLTRQTREALDGLTRGIRARKGLLLLTGEVGTGKTTLLNHLLDSLHEQRTPTAYIFNSHLEVSHLFDFVLTDFGVKFDSSMKDNAVLRLQQWLLERYRAGETPVLIVDEAQGLSDEVIEEIRMLLNLECCSEKLLQVVLAGQPELEERLQQPALRQMKQRIALRSKTAALSLEEAHEYVQARLRIAGSDVARIFAAEAVDAVHFYSRGIPRVMNLLCEHALINASVEQIQPVPEHFVAEVAREFQFDDIRPVAADLCGTEAGNAVPTSGKSRFMNALVSLTGPAEPILRAYPNPTVIRAPRWLGSPDFGPIPEPAGEFLDGDEVTDDCGAAAGPTPLSVPAAATVAPWQTQLQAKLLSDWSAFFVEVGSALIKNPPGEATVQPAKQPVLQRAQHSTTQRTMQAGAQHAIQPEAQAELQSAPASETPRLHLVAPKTTADGSLGGGGRHGRCADASTHPSFKVGAAESELRGSSVLKVVPLRLVVIRWTLKWSNGLLCSATSIAWAPPPAILFQLPRCWIRKAKSNSVAVLARAERFVAPLTSIDWPRVKTTTGRWLRQPCDPTQWRLLDPRLFEDRSRFSEKKCNPQSAARR